MNYNTFEIRTKIVFGNGSLERLKELTFKKCFIVTDKFIADGKIIKEITNRLDAIGVTYTTFYDIAPNAPLSKIALGLKACVDYDPDCMITIGGGSAIDTAKTIRQMYHQINNKLLYFIVIPTTSGTGSEVTSYSVVLDENTETKHALFSNDMLPNEALLDSNLVLSVPPVITADTGMDVLTHSIEAYVSKEHNDYTDAFATKAIEMISQYLLRSYYDNTDIEARTKMHHASNIAGIAFNSAKLGINHSIAHALGGAFSIAHGRANAIVLPHVIAYNSGVMMNKKDFLPGEETEKAVERYAKIAKTLGVANFNRVSSIKSLINWVQFMNKEMQIPSCIEEMHICNIEEYMSNVDIMVEHAMNDSCTATNPRTVSKEDLKNIFIRLWH